MNKFQRHYNKKDVDMLITAGTIIESAITNKEALQEERSTWADPYFEDQKARINNAMQVYLGVDSAKHMRQATIAINGLSRQAMKDLAMAKVQVEEDFKNDKPRRDEITKQLGFTSYLKAAQKRDQEALINLLFQFSQNATPQLQQEIAGKGMSQALITRIIGYATKLKDADVTQESFKGVKKTITQEAITEFNAIYDNIISICKISAKILIDKGPLKEQFSFDKVSKALNIHRSTPPPEE
jgi:hypothetical protein